MDPLEVISQSGLKAGISTVALLGIDKYNNYKLDNMRALTQGSLSLFSNSIEGLVRPLLPAGAQVSAMWMQPILVGSCFTLVCKVMFKDKAYKYNFACAMGSELIALWSKDMVSAFTNPSRISAGAYMMPPVPQRPLTVFY